MVAKAKAAQAVVETVRVAVAMEGAVEAAPAKAVAELLVAGPATEAPREAVQVRSNA